jgi:DNA helicase IV
MPSEDVKIYVQRRWAAMRSARSQSRSRLLAMTVQQAKNREFDGVVVLWPYSVGGDAEQKRRLLYNALTRAKRWAAVVAQGPSVVTSSPFA